MAIFSGKKEAISKVMDHLGLARVAACLPRKPQLAVFNYHRIGSIIGNPYDDAVFSATPEAFRDQLIFIKRHFDLPPPDDVLAATTTGGFGLQRPTALITFDDGYRDNYELALPVLKQCGVSALFFIPTEFVDRPRLSWWDRIAYAVKHTTVNTLELDFPERASFDLHQIPRRLVVKRVLDIFKKNVGRSEDEFITHLEDRARVQAPDAVSHRWIVTWDEIREMKAAGMVIGSHTHTHTILSGMDEAAQRRELEESKAILERETGGTISVLSYPVGSRSAFSEATKRMAREAGYKMAFSKSGGVNTADRFDPFDVFRIAVEANESMSVFRVRLVLNSVFGRNRP